MYRSALARPEEWGFLRKTLGWGLVLFLLSGVVTVPEVWAATYYVNAATGDNGRSPAMAQSSSTPWKTLTKALANVTSGDDVQVASGTYDAALGETYPLELKSGVAIEGAGKATTTLSAPAGTDVFYNDDTPLSSGTTLTGFTLTHDGTSSGQSLIDLEPQTVDMAPVISDNAFQSKGSPYEYGLSVESDTDSLVAHSFSGTISNNTFNDFYVGLYLSAELEAQPGGNVIFSPTVSGNTFTDNEYAISANMGDTQGTSFQDTTKIVDNVATNSGMNDVYYNVDFETGNASSQPMISGNTFTGAQDDSIFVSMETLETNNDSPSGSKVITASPTITNNTIQSPVGDGIEVYYSEADAGSVIAHATISGNKITSSTDEGGIYLGIEEEFYPDGDQTDLDLVIANNSVTNTADSGIVVSAYSLDQDPVLNNSSSTIAGNVVDMPGTTGIVDLWEYSGAGEGTLSRVISGNTVTNGDIEADGIYAEGTEQSSLDAANLAIKDNVVDQGFNNGVELYYADWPSASKVLASCNTVTNNLHGFVVDSSGNSTADSQAPDLGGGGSGSPGLNSFHDNSIADFTAETDHQFAQSNWWGTTDSSTIASHIDGSYAGNVDFTNFLSGPPTVTASNELAASLSGTVINYTATLDGTGQCGCASSTFTAPTPANTTVIPGSVAVSGGIGPSVQGEDPVTVWVGELGAGETVTVTWSVQVDKGYQGDISDQASFGCTQLAADVASDDPSTAPPGDPTVINIAPASVVPVPTLQTAGLATLIVLLLLAGWFLVEDKRRRLLLMLVLGLSLGALGVRAAVLAPVQAGAATPAKAATAKTHKARSPEAVAKARQAHLALRSLRAATVLQVAVQGSDLHLAFSDGTTLTVPRARVHMLPIKLDKAAKRGLTRTQKRVLQRQRAAARRIENLHPGQAVMVGVRYAADGSVRSLHLRPEVDLAAARAEAARIEAKRAARARRAAAGSH